MSIAIGKSKFGSGRKDFKVKKDEPITARIIPPIGELASKGKWAVFHAVEWGYKGSDDKMKPFLDVHVMNRKTKMVEVQSAAYTRRDALKKNFDIVSAKFKAGQATEEEKNKAFSLVRRYNLDKKFYLNVKTLSGELGVLKINYKLYQALKTEIDRLVAGGIDPTSVDNGRFFTFSSTNATGSLQDWMFTVTEHKESINTAEHGIVQKPVVDVLTPDVIDRLGSECSELNQLFKTVTAADVDRFVNEGPTAIDEILGSKSNTKATPTSVQEAAPTSVQEAAPTPAPVQQAAPVQEPILNTPAETLPAPAAQGVQTDEELEYLRNIGAI